MKSLISYLLLISLSLSSCHSVKKHSWEVTEAPQKALEKAEWKTVSQDLYTGVSKEKTAFAEEMLASNKFIELSLSLELMLTGHWKKSSSTYGLKPFLIRGLTSGQPWSTEVRYNEKENIIAVERNIYIGEILLPYREHKHEAWPVVIYLSKAPANVYCYVRSGGDRVLRGKDFRQIE